LAAAEQTGGPAGRTEQAPRDALQPPAAPAARRRAAIAKGLVLAALLLAVNWWQLPLLVSKWLHDDNWTHGFVIPLFSLYLIYSRWGELRSAPRRVCPWGLAILVFAILLSIVAYWPIRTHWLAHAGMLLMVFGLVLYLAGPRVIRATWLPILFPIFAMPLPERLYAQIAVPLQELAARATAGLLRLFAVGIEIKASSLRVLGRSGEWHSLTVAEACSGMRALMAFVALGVAMAWLEDRPLWQRLVMIVLAVPIAVASNCIRVALTCAMYAIDRPDLGQDFIHSFMGMVLLVPAFFMFLLVGWVLRKLLVDVPEEPPPRAAEGRTA